MPIQFSISDHDGARLLHLPDEIVNIAAATERRGEQLVVFCRDESRARALGHLLLTAEVSSAMLPPDVDGETFKATVEAFSLQDFAVLLLTDAHNCGWAAPPTCRQVLHADLPAAAHAGQMIDALADREARVTRVIRLNDAARASA